MPPSTPPRLAALLPDPPPGSERALVYFSVAERTLPIFDPAAGASPAPMDAPLPQAALRDLLRGLLQADPLPAFGWWS